MNAAIDWKAEAKKIVFRDKAFIGGVFVGSLSGKTFDCISPVDGRLLARIAACGPEDIDVAVRAARAAFESGDCSAGFSTTEFPAASAGANFHAAIING